MKIGDYDLRSFKIPKHIARDEFSAVVVATAGGFARTSSGLAARTTSFIAFTSLEVGTVYFPSEIYLIRFILRLLPLFLFPDRFVSSWRAACGWVCRLCRSIEF